MRRICICLAFIVAATALAQQPPAPAPGPGAPPVVAFEITEPDDEGGTVVPVINATYPFVGGTYPAEMSKDKIYVTIVDANANVIAGGQAFMKDGVFVWQSANSYTPTNPVFIWADNGKFGGQISNSVKANMK